jgi:hypothetical protein
VVHLVQSNQIRIRVGSQKKSLANKTDIVISEIAAIALDHQREMNEEERGAGLRIDTTETETETEIATATAVS